jgi:hypothetical protein
MIDLTSCHFHIYVAEQNYLKMFALLQYSFKSVADCGLATYKDNGSILLTANTIFT